MENKAKDCRPSAYKGSRTTFSILGNKDLQKLQKVPKVQKLQKAKVAKVSKVATKKASVQIEQKTASQPHIKPPEHNSLDLEIKICKRCKSGNISNVATIAKGKNGKSCKSVKKVPKVQNKAKDYKPTAFKGSRTTFSRFGDKDWQKL